MKQLALFLCILSSAFAHFSDDTQLSKKEDLRKKLKEKYEKVHVLQAENASANAYKELIGEIQALRTQLSAEDKKYIQEKSEMQDQSAFWDQGETTLSQLIIEYGSGDSLYIIPPELSNIKLQLFSMIPIPRAVWEDMLELILLHNGIGVKKINSFSKQLYILKHDPANIGAITTKYSDLALIEDHVRILFLLSPPLEKIKATQSFFERFSDPKQTSVQVVGSKVVLVSSKQNIEKLLEIYHTVWESDQKKSLKIFRVKKLKVAEAEELLKKFFHANDPKIRSSIYHNMAEELQIMPLPDALVLIGENNTIARAESILKQMEDELQDPEEMTIFWYQCKHTDPEEIARLLDQVYDSLFSHKETSYQKKNSLAKEKNGLQALDSSKKRFGNFIVDGKTGAIMMVIRREDIGKIKSILRRLDVPKKMVEIEVILVEKKNHNQKQSGINLLKLGDSLKPKKTSLTFDAQDRSERRGVLDFILTTPKSKFPSFDLTLSLLMSQENVHLHANPTLLAMNQTPATFSIVEEISINNGAIHLDGGKKGAVEKSFTRAQYGTTINITPMIHSCEGEKDFAEKNFVTLQTNITFETTQMSQDDRPPVTRRHVENEIRVGDGETIVIGGLRRKSKETKKEKIPFLGDIPGLGKLCGVTRTSESNTEMFIFITPHILKDPALERLLQRKMQIERRPGDSESFLQKIQEAKMLEKKSALQEGMHMLFEQFYEL